MKLKKAHPDLFNILLQIMDYGMLTDSNGRKADFRHVIIIMTTNAGAIQLTHEPMGFAGQDAAANNMEEIKRVFSPEFRNRLDAIINFNHLPTDIIAKVVDKHVLQLEQRLLEKNVTLKIAQSAKDWLVKKGYDKQLGARPIERLITDTIKVPLAKELLFGDIDEKERHEVNIKLSQGALSIKVSKKKKVLKSTDKAHQLESH